MNDRDLDDRLRRAFAPPADADFERAARAATTTAPAGHGRWPVLLAAAAALLLLWTVFGGGAAGAPAASRPGAAELGALWVAAYRDAVANDFDSSCCEPGVDLPARCRAEFAAPLALADDAGLLLRGCYCGMPTGGCLMLLADRTEQRFCVYVLPADRDPGVVLPAGCGLHLSRRVVGALTVYAVADEQLDDVLEPFVVP